MIYRLIVLNGPAKGQHITVDPEPVIIGREESCGIILPDNEMALNHARLEQRDDDLFITDLGSMHKILLNKHEVQNSRLKHGDIIELGRTRLLVQAVVRAEVNSAGEQPVALKHSGRKRKLALAATMLLIAGGTFAIIRSQGEHEPAPLAEAPAAEILPDVAPAPAVVAIDNTADVKTQPTNEDFRLLIEGLSAIQEQIQQLGSTPPAASAAAKVEELPPIDDLEAAMKAARDFMEAGQYEDAQKILEHLQFEKPDYLPAYQLSAEMFEKLGLPGKARDQWGLILRRAPESDPLHRKSVLERIRLGLAESETSVSAHDALRIEDIEASRFPDAEDYDEMRTIKVHLTYNRNLGPIDPNAVRLVLRFFEQQVDSQLIVTSSVQPYVEVNLKSLLSGMGDRFTFTVNYVVPRGRSESDPSAGRLKYFGCVAQLHYFDHLVDEDAKPRMLLNPAVMEAAGLVTQRTAGATIDLTTPASN